LSPDALVCNQCHALTYGDDLEVLSAWAKSYEEKDQLQQAREQWEKALPLLPPDSTQAKWVSDKIRKLEVEANVRKIVKESPDKTPAWVKKLGPLAPIAVALAKGKSLLVIFKLKFLLSLVTFLGFYWALFGPKFGIGFAVLILIHEMGHYIDVKRRGLPVDMPVFLPGFGAYVKWQALGVSKTTRAAISLAGPLAGLLSAGACVLLWWHTGNQLWAALARTGAWLNVLNLIPIWVLDGGQAMLALNKIERILLLTLCLVLWLVVGEGVFFLVAAAACWRLFTRDIPAEPSHSITAYFAVVAASLAFVLWLVPGNGAGNF